VRRRRRGKKAAVSQVVQSGKDPSWRKVSRRVSEVRKGKRGSAVLTIGRIGVKSAGDGLQLPRSTQRRCSVLIAVKKKAESVSQSCEAGTKSRGPRSQLTRAKRHITQLEAQIRYDHLLDTLRQLDSVHPGFPELLAIAALPRAEPDALYSTRQLLIEGMQRFVHSFPRRQK
jgi:hypothetical protein